MRYRLSVPLLLGYAVWAAVIVGAQDAPALKWLNNFPVPGRVNHPLLWDRDGKPKPAFDAVVRVLQEKQKGASQ
jgi:GH35 family endo-1,4-beta-xylanase